MPVGVIDYSYTSRIKCKNQFKDQEMFSSDDESHSQRLNSIQEITIYLKKDSPLELNTIINFFERQNMMIIVTYDCQLIIRPFLLMKTQTPLDQYYFQFKLNKVPENNNNKENESAKKIFRLVKRLLKIYGSISKVKPIGMIKNINPEETTSIKESLEPCGMDTCVMGSVLDQNQYGKIINTISAIAMGKKVKNSLYRLKAKISVDFAT